jgi:hypothetical protein
MSAPTPATFHLPHSSLEPLELTLKMPSLAMAVVPRDAISALVDKWAKAIGVYVLLGPSDDDEHDYRAYAGQSAPAMRRRLTGVAAVLATFVVSLVFGYLAVRGVDFDAAWHAFSHEQRLVVRAVACGACGFRLHARDSLAHPVRPSAPTATREPDQGNADRLLLQQHSAGPCR